MEHFTLPDKAKSGAPELTAKIEEAIQSFCTITDVPVTFFNTKGEIKWECHKQNKFCSFFNVYQDPKSVCMKNLISSSKLAAQLGEPYVFVCRAGLVKIAISLIINGQVLGCFMAGPIIMGALKERVITSVFSLNDIHLDSYHKIILFLKNMKTLNPKEVYYLATLFGNNILAAVTSNEYYSSVSSQYKEQQRIGENLQKYKKENKAMPYPYELSERLIKSVKDGNYESTLVFLGELLDELSLEEAGNLSSIKIKILGICAIISRIAAEKSVVTYEQFDSYFDDLYVLNQAASFQELSVLACDLVGKILKVISADGYSGNSQIIKLALQYINENYMNKISLKPVADHLHVNPSYLSMLFKHETGLTFTDNLNKIRVNQSCKLLAGSNINLTEVAVQSGFDDQSYFTKVFRKAKGTTPNNYRKLHYSPGLKSGS